MSTGPASPGSRLGRRAPGLELYASSQTSGELRPITQMTRTIPHGKTRRSGPGLWYRVSHMDDSVSPAISEARTTGIYRDDRLFAEPQSVADGVLHASLYSKRCARYSRRDCCDAFAFACAAVQQRRPSRTIAAGVQAWPRRRAEPRRLRFRRFPSTRRVRFQADRLRFRSLVSSRADRIRFPHTVCNAAFVSTPFPPLSLAGVSSGGRLARVHPDSPPAGLVLS